MKTLAFTALALAIAPVAFAAPAHAPKAATKPAVLVCPITGEKISSAATAYSHETYKGKTYYFCCPACKPKFDKNPDKAVANAAHGKFGAM